MADEPQVKQTGSVEEFMSFIGKHWKTLAMICGALGVGIAVPAKQIDLVHLTGRVDSIDVRLTNTERKVDKLDSKVDDLSRKFDDSIGKISDKLDGIIDTQAKSAVEIAVLSKSVMPIDQVKTALNPTNQRVNETFTPPDKPKRKRVGVKAPVVSEKSETSPQPIAEKPRPVLKGEEATWLEKVFTK